MTEFADIKKLIEDQGKAWNEYQKANDAKIEAIQKGLPTAELQAKIDLINKDLTEQQKSFREIEKKVNRPKLGKDEKELTEDQIAHKKAFNEYLRKGNTDGLASLQLKAMNAGTDTDGGYTVLPEMDQTIDRIVPTISALGRLANNVTIGSQKWEKLVKTSGMALNWVANGATAGEVTEPKYAKIQIEAYVAEVEPWVFNETLQDSFVDLETDLANEAGIGFAEGIGAALITGNGVGRPFGLTSYTNVANASYAWGSVGYITSGKSAAFASVSPADKVVSLQHALKSQYRPGACFLTNDSTLGLMRQIKDGSGRYYLWNPDPAAGFGGTFLGSPVEIDDNFVAIGAGTYSLAYGNFKRAYALVNRAGVSVIRDNITAKGQTKFNFRKRIGGGIYNFEAVKLMKFATS